MLDDDKLSRFILVFKVKPGKDKSMTQNLDFTEVGQSEPQTGPELTGQK